MQQHSQLWCDAPCQHQSRGSLDFTPWPGSPGSQPWCSAQVAPGIWMGLASQGRQKFMVVPACTGSQVHKIKMLTTAERLNCLQDNYGHRSTRALNTANHKLKLQNWLKVRIRVATEINHISQLVWIQSPLTSNTKLLKNFNGFWSWLQRGKSSGTL